MYIRNSLLRKVVKSMNMNKIFKIFICVIIGFLLINVNKVSVNAQTTTALSCSTFTNKKKCEAMSYKCRWISGSCQEQNVAQEPCNDNNIRKVLKIFGYFLLIAKVIIPLMIIGFGTFDLYKSVVDKDEKSIYKQLKVLGFRILAGMVVFFIPNIIYAVFGLSDRLNIIDTEEYNVCATCVLDPLNEEVCSVTE